MADQRIPDIKTLERDIVALQLLEVSIYLIEGIREYAEENEIILGGSQKLDRLLNEAKTLLEEENYLTQPSKLKNWLTDDFLQRKRTDEDFTEPKIVRFIFCVGRGRVTITVL